MKAVYYMDYICEQPLAKTEQYGLEHLRNRLNGLRRPFRILWGLPLTHPRHLNNLAWTNRQRLTETRTVRSFLESGLSPTTPPGRSVLNATFDEIYFQRLRTRGWEYISHSSLGSFVVNWMKHKKLLRE